MNKNQGKSKIFFQPSGRIFQPSGRKLLKKNNHVHEEPESDISFYNEEQESRKI